MELMRGLDRSRFEPILINFKNPNHFRDEAAAHGWRTMRVPVSRSYRPRDIDHLARVLRDERIDVLHAHSDFANFAGRAAAVLAGVPYKIAHYHNTYEHRLNKYFHGMEALLAPHTDMVLTCSKGIEDFCQRNFEIGETPVRVVLNGIDLRPYEKALADRPGCRKRIGVPDEVFHIVHTARLEPHKAPQRLLKALSLSTVKGNSPLGNWRATFVGGGSLLNRLKEVIFDLDAQAEKEGGSAIAPNVQLVGWSKDIPSYLAAADAFVLCSKNEGLSLSLIEAMATGTPVIAPDIIGPQEVVTPEENGLLIDASRPVELLDALVRLKTDDDLRARLVDGGLQRAQDFNRERFLGEMEKTYEELVAGAPADPPRRMDPISRAIFRTRFSRLARKSRTRRKEWTP